MANGPRPSVESIARGKLLYDARVEYPLPEAADVRDYIFYFSRNGDDYTQNARAFLRKVYPRHREFRNVRSLSEIIDKLHADIMSGAVQQPREIVLVGHATPHSVGLPIMRNPPAPLQKSFELTDLLSLSDLQKAVQAGGNAQIDQFEQKRRVVVDRLTDQSWVVLRACRFGQNKGGVHALFAFFGGRANLYAAKNYTFFVSSGVGLDHRFKTRASVYEHMADQRLVKPRRRTPDRKLSLVTLIAEPGQFTGDAPIRSANLSQDSPARTDYLADVDSLENGTVPPSVATALLTNFAITLDQPVVSVPQTRSFQGINTASNNTMTRWIFRDSMPTELDLFQAELLYLPSQIFDLEVTVEDTRRSATDVIGEMQTSAQIIERGTPKGKPRKKVAMDLVNFQLMVDDAESSDFKGFLFVLAQHVQDNPSPEEVANYNAIRDDLDALAAGVNPAATLRLEAILNGRADFAVTPGTLTVSLGPLAGLSWRLSGDGEAYIIVEDEHKLVDGQKFSRLRLKKHFADEKARKVHQEYYIDLPGWGADSDIPGVELMAWLDRLGVDGLKDIIDFMVSVKDTRRVQMFHTWRHAVDALGDKHAPHKILLDTNSSDPLYGLPGYDPYDRIYDYGPNYDAILEAGHRAYQFASRQHWQQAKGLFVLDPPVQSDLFTEQALPAPLEQVRTIPWKEDSPSYRANQLSPREKEIYNRLTGGSKFSARSPDIKETECEEFRRWVEEFIRISKLPDGDIDAALAVLPELSRPQEGNAVMLAISVLGILGTLLERTSVGEKVAIGLSARYPLIANLRIVGLNPAQFMGAVSLLGTIWTVGSYMLLNFFADANEANNATRQAGAGLAFRHYAILLRRQIAAHAPNFPTTLNINARPPVGEDVGLYAIKVAQSLNSNPNGTHFNNLYFGHKTFLGEGYMTGVSLAEKAAERALRNAQGRFNSALRRAGLKQCMIDTLRDTGFVQPGNVRAYVMRETANQINQAGQPGAGRN